MNMQAKQLYTNEKQQTGLLEACKLFTESVPSLLL